MSEVDKCGHEGGIFKLQWTFTKSTIVLTFVIVCCLVTYAEKGQSHPILWYYELSATQ